MVAKLPSSITMCLHAWHTNHNPFDLLLGDTNATLGLPSGSNYDCCWCYHFGLPASVPKTKKLHTKCRHYLNLYNVGRPYGSFCRACFTPHLGRLRQLRTLTLRHIAAYRLNLCNHIIFVGWYQLYHVDSHESPVLSIPWFISFVWP